MSDSNRTRVGIVAESAFGVTPNSPVFQTLRVTSSSLSFSPKTTSSTEIRADRQVSDLILVGADAQGDLGMELSFSSQDALLEGAMFSSFVKTPEIQNATAGDNITSVDSATDTWNVAAGGSSFVTGMLVQATGFTNSVNNQIFQVASSTATTVVAGGSVTTTNEAVPPASSRLKAVGFKAVSGDVLAVTAGGNALVSTTLDFTTLPLAVGVWIKIGGTTAGTYFDTATVNGWARVSAIAANRLSFDVVPSGWVADAGASKTVVIFFGDYLRNGTGVHSFTIEQAFLDNGQYQYLYGMMVSNMTVTADAQSIMKAQVGFMGKNGQYVSSRVTGATHRAPTTTDVLNTSSNVGRIAESGSVVSGPNFVMSCELKIENKLRAQNAIGVVGAVGIGVGQCHVTGQMKTYFGDSTLLQKVVNNTASSFDIRVADNAGHTILWDLPKIKFSGGTTPVTGIDTDIMADLPFQALVHPTLGYTVHLQKFEVTTF